MACTEKKLIKQNIFKYNKIKMNYFSVLLCSADQPEPGQQDAGSRGLHTDP